MEFAVGGADMAAYLPLLEEELAFRGEDRRAPGWRKADIAPDVRVRGRHHRRRHVGPARRAPVAAGRRPLRHHREERRRRRHLAREHAIRAAGSTTRTTTTATRSRSATTGRCTSRRRTCCSTTSGAAPTTSALRDHIRFGTEVLSATWSETDAHWTVAVRDAGRRRGVARGERGDQRGRPAEPAVVPDIEGRESFAGPSFHSARWDHCVDLRGKRVAVIGTGAERGAVHPRDRAKSASCSCFQRTPPWFGPTPEYHDEVARGPALALRARAVVQRVEPLLDLLEDGRRRAAGVRVDPDWEPKGARSA